MVVGARKYVFPLSQLLDGQAAQGIREIVDIVDSPRRAGVWMMKSSPLLGNKRPIDLLKLDHRHQDVDAARTVFGRA